MSVTQVIYFMCDQCKQTYPNYKQAAKCSDVCTVPVKWEGGSSGTVHYEDHQ